MKKILMLTLAMAMIFGNTVSTMACENATENSVCNSTENDGKVRV